MDCRKLIQYVEELKKVHSLSSSELEMVLNQDERIVKLEGMVKTLEDELNAFKDLLTFRAEFWDYASEFIQYISYMYDQNSEESDFDILRKQYEKEKRTAKFQKKTILSLPNTKLLVSHLSSFNLSLEDFDHLCEFCDGRNEIFHSGKKFAHEDWTNFIRRSKQRLEDSTPLTMILYKPCLTEAVNYALDSVESEGDSK